jgi:hypothetical protein
MDFLECYQVCEIFVPSVSHQRVLIAKEAFSNQVDKVTHIVDVGPTSILSQSRVI